ncbi:MAG: AAA family ATPase [Candidatus Cybelea sp.]
MSALADFAERKHLPLEELERRHVSDEPGGGIRFDYGPDARARIRKNAASAHPTFWAAGDSRPMRALGYHLAERFAKRADKTLLIVEGESDALTAWLHGRPALGIPGATMPGVIARDDVTWANRAMIVREPGDAGQKFVGLVAKRLRDVGFAGDIFEISLAPHKDVSDLHVAVEGDRKRFGEALDAAIAEASKVSTPSAAPDSLGVLSDDDLLALATTHVDWLVEGLLRESGIMILSARPKVGKSELARNLAKAVATGSPFLGRRCRKGKVVWVGLEEPTSHLHERLEVHGLLGLGIQWVTQQPAGDEAAWLRNVVERYKPDLIIIDTIARLLRIEDINHYSEVARATQIMLDLRSQYGVGFCAIHHNNRADSTLGSVQWEAFCDSIMLLTRSPEGERFVRTVQRSGSDMESARLEHDQDTGSITIAEPKIMADQRAAEQRILRYAGMVQRPATREELARHSGRLNSIGRAAVDGLVTAGLLVASGKGTRSDPRVYALSSDPTKGSNNTSVSSLSSEAIQLGEDSDESEKTFRRHSEETPMLSEDSDESEPSEHSGDDLLGYAREVLGDE